MSGAKVNFTIVTVKRQFRAPAATVFDAFLDPRMAGRFMFATDNGEMVKAEIDARVGGGFNFTDRRDGEDVAHTGEYLAIERPRRLVFSLQVKKYSQETDRVTIGIKPLQSGCELTLTHELEANWASARGQIEEGWRAILELAAAALGEPYIKSLYVQQSVDIKASPRTVWRVLTDSELSRQWIAFWWPDVTLKSDWEPGSSVIWEMPGGAVGAEGEITLLKKDPDPMMILEFTFRVIHQGAPKQEKIKYFISQEQGYAKLSVFVGNFGDTPEHEQCYPGAEEAWKRSLPKIKELAEAATN